MVNTKEQLVSWSIQDSFEGEDMQIQYSVLGYGIDLYFHDYKLAIEVVESGHNYRNIDQEIQRQKAIENSVPSLLELILINKILIFLEPWIKYKDTFKKSTKKL